MENIQAEFEKEWDAHEHYLPMIGRDELYEIVKSVYRCFKYLPIQAMVFEITSMDALKFTFKLEGGYLLMVTKPLGFEDKDFPEDFVAFSVWKNKELLIADGTNMDRLGENLTIFFQEYNESDD